MELSETKYFDAAFDFSLLLKGIFSLMEIGAGLFIYFSTRSSLLDMAQDVTRLELIEDPHDFIANHLLHAAQHLSVSSQHFSAIYLFSHGVIKLWLIIGLFRKKLGYYPAAMIVFSVFIAYQLYRFSLTGSLSLLLITSVDVLVIWLTMLEYQHLRKVVNKA